jgi:molybdopterin-guanine dinucleotide biosynthesis protein MobB
MNEHRGTQEPSLPELLAKLDPVDLILIEGWKRDSHPKVEAWRAETGNPLIAPNDPTILAVASDIGLEIDRPVFDLDDTAVVADFILDYLDLTK